MGSAAQTAACAAGRRKEPTPHQGPGLWSQGASHDFRLWHPLWDDHCSPASSLRMPLGRGQTMAKCTLCWAREGDPDGVPGFLLQFGLTLATVIQAPTIAAIWEVNQLMGEFPTLQPFRQISQFQRKKGGSTRRGHFLWPLTTVVVPPSQGPSCLQRLSPEEAEGCWWAHSTRPSRQPLSKI